MTRGQEGHIIGGMEPKMFTAHIPLEYATLDRAVAELDKVERALVVEHDGLELANKRDEKLTHPLDGAVLRRTWWFYPPGIRFTVRGYEYGDEILSSQEFTRRNS